jgi:nucleoside-diphosphate-sugar epimerase
VELKNARVLVTGGTSFIGSHLVEQLVARVGSLRVIDNLSSGRIGYLEPLISDGVEFIEADLLDQSAARRSLDGIDLVFHLAADHGGRGSVDLHQAACASNLALDGIMFDAASRAGVEKVVYASSGCVYPNFRSQDPDEILYLTEEAAGPPFDADNMYGWAKLMAE